MSSNRTRLWPYSLVAAIIAVPAIWASLSILFFATRTYLQWPVSGYETPLLFFSIGLSAFPVIMLLVDFVAAKGGVIGTKWVNVDFSKTVVESGSAKRESFALTDNIYILSEQESIADSGGRITAALKKATIAEVVFIDLKDGNVWWVTRLLALCAGAVGAGSPKVIVFVGRRENRDRHFLGCGIPRLLLEAILDSNPEYRSRFRRASMIARQLALFGRAASELPLQLDVSALRRSLAIDSAPSGAPAPPQQPIGLHSTVGNSAYHYDENESAMLAKILIEELRKSSSPSPEAGTTRQINLEEPPDRLTVGRLSELFDRCLYRDAIDRSWSNDQQLSRFLDSAAPYVAVVRRGVYEAMLRSDLGERAIIRMLFAQSTDAPRGTSATDYAAQ
jgi:hypothetical protein